MKYAIVFLLVFGGYARADTYHYQCKVNGKSYTLEVDDTLNELTWRGKSYQIKPQESCARFGWTATRQGETFDFCTATQGYADFTENGASVQCDQKR